MTQVTSKPRTATRTIKADATIAKAVDQAREAAEYRAGDFGVGEHVGTIAEGERVLTHLFECPHPGYRGWRWAVTMSRALRGRNVTVNEVVLVPGEDSLLAPPWVPWRDRVRAGDIAAGTLMPTADNDPRLEPGYTGGELAADDHALHHHPADAAQQCEGWRQRGLHLRSAGQPVAAAGYSRQLMARRR